MILLQTQYDFLSSPDRRSILIFLAIAFIAVTASVTAWPPSRAPSADCMAIFSVCRALSAFWRILATISSIDDETSSAVAACSVAPCDISSAPRLIAWLPEATVSAVDLTLLTTAFRRWLIVFKACMSVSWADRSLSSTVRSPSAIASASSPHRLPRFWPQRP